MKKLFVLAASAAVIATPAAAAPGDTSTASGAATAEVVAPIELTHVTGAALSFGTFTTGDNGGTVVVDNAGDGTATGDVDLLSDSTESTDAFTVEGDDSRSFTISTTGGSVTNGTDSMSFTTSAPGTGTLDGNGDASFVVSGTLTVVGGETSGTYTGSYSVTVAYN